MAGLCAAGRGVAGRGVAGCCAARRGARSRAEPFVDVPVDDWRSSARRVDGSWPDDGRLVVARPVGVGAARSEAWRVEPLFFPRARRVDPPRPDEPSDVRNAAFRPSATAFLRMSPHCIAASWHDRGRKQAGRRGRASRPRGARPVAFAVGRVRARVLDRPGVRALTGCRPSGQRSLAARHIPGRRANSWLCAPCRVCGRSGARAGARSTRCLRADRLSAERPEIAGCSAHTWSTREQLVDRHRARGTWSGRKRMGRCTERPREQRNPPYSAIRTSPWAGGWWPASGSASPDGAVPENLEDYRAPLRTCRTKRPDESVTGREARRAVVAPAVIRSPTHADLHRPALARANPRRAGPARADPRRAGPTRADPCRAGPTHADQRRPVPDLRRPAICADPRQPIRKNSQEVPRWSGPAFVPRRAGTSAPGRTR